MSATNYQLPPPPPFAIHDVGVPELWKEWRVSFMAYLTAAKLNKEEVAVQVSMLLTIISAEVHRVFLILHWKGKQINKVWKK